MGTRRVIEIETVTFIVARNWEIDVRSKLLCLLAASALAACGSSETEDVNSTSGFSFKERFSCDDFAVCFDGPEEFDRSFAYLSDRDRGITIEIRQDERPLEAVHSLVIIVPWDIPIDVPQPVDSDATPGIRASVFYNLRGFSSANPSDAGGGFTVRSISESSIEIEFQDLHFKQNGEGIFLLRDATFSFDCIGEAKGNGCGTYIDIDQCGVERSFANDDCMG